MKKNLTQFQLALLVTLVVALGGCSKNNPTAPLVAPSQGKMTFQLAAVANIASGSVTITKNGTVLNKTIAMANNTGSVQFDSIEIGTWNVAVKLLDNAGVEIYTGSATAIVNKNETTLLNVLVSENKGNLLITVGVPTPVITATAVRTGTPVTTATAVRTGTPVITATAIRTGTPVITATAIRTGTPVTTATTIRTSTPVTTATTIRTSTPVITATAVRTSTPVITATAIRTRTPVITPTATRTATRVFTATAIPTSTPIPTATPAPALIYEDFEAVRPPVIPWIFTRLQPTVFATTAMIGTDITSPAGSWVASRMDSGTLFDMACTWASYDGNARVWRGLRNYTNAQRVSIWVKLNPQYGTSGVIRPYVYAILSEHDYSYYTQNIYGNQVQITSGAWVKVSMELKDFNGNVSGNLVPYPAYLRQSISMGVELSTPNGNTSMLEVDGFRLE